ncbi:MAG: hypothetical protein ABFR32_08285 [Bacteroidota bacterium]
MKYSLIIISLLVLNFGFAQNNNLDEIALEKQILKHSKSNGDPLVTTNSLYRLIALEGEKSTYKDSLAYLYFSSRKYAPCYMLATDVLKRYPKNVNMLEMQAISLESLGAIDKAVGSYKELFAITNNNYHGYSLAKLQYSIKEFDQAFTTIQKVEKLNDSGNYRVTYAINKTHTQQIELIAAIQYLKGLIAVELKKDDIAIISFQNAIKIQPEFVLAKENLESLNEKKDKE